MQKMMKSLAALAGVAMINSTAAFGVMTVSTTDGILNVQCDRSGTVIVKVVAPNDGVIVDERYEGHQFTWSPSGMDGAYRYDVRVVIPPVEAQENAALGEKKEAVSEYAGGSVEVRGGKIINPPMHEGAQQ